MATNQPPASATIYQFPARVLGASRGSSSQRAKSALVLRPQPKLPAIVEFGSGWYHDAAIQADAPRK